MSQEIEGQFRVVGAASFPAPDNYGLRPPPEPKRPIRWRYYLVETGAFLAFIGVFIWGIVLSQTLRHFIAPVVHAHFH